MLKEKLLKKALELYAGRHVLERVLELEDKAFVRGGEVVRGTLYTQAINAFSNYSGLASPEEVITCLSNYLDISVEAITDFKGTIDSISGDLIITYWKEDISGNNEQMACEAALRSLQNIRQKDSLRSFNVVIGIHSGEFILGNLGSKYRLIHTIMGDALNLTSRLSSANKYYGTNILITQTVRNNLGADVICRELDTLGIVGKDEPITIYELFGYSELVSSDQREMLQFFGDGLSEYKNNKWKNAGKIFDSIIKKYKHDGPTELYLKRIKEFQKNPPPKKRMER